MVSVLPILMYHNIGTRPAATGAPRMYVTAETFRKELSWLRRLGYRVRSLRDACDVSRDKEIGRTVALTFDDGYVDNFETALPILREFGFTATCFFVSRALEGTGRSETMKMTDPVMQREQAAEWLSAGMEAGSHTRTHANLTACAPEALRAEVRDSKHELEDMLGVEISSFAYPFGAYNEAIVEEVKSAGYRRAVTTRGGRARAGDDRFRLRRVGVHGGMFRFCTAIFSDYQQWRDKRPL